MKLTAIVAMVCITLLVALGLWKGINGALLMSGMTLIGGLGGFSIGRMTARR